MANHAANVNISERTIIIMILLLWLVKKRSPIFNEIDETIINIKATIDFALVFESLFIYSNE